MMKSFSLFLLIFWGLIFSAQAQNCGQVLNFTASIADNGNGTSNYTFFVETAPVSGGTKSVLLTISCGTYSFVTNQCYQAPSGGTTLTIGPFNNVSNCTSTPSLTWTGHTNDKCGGSSCAGTTVALPVELIYIKTSKMELGVKLDWATASELNNQGFEVQRSSDTQNWVNIGWVPGFGNSNSVIENSFQDEHPENGVNYYRLKQIDYDGNFEYSEKKSVNINSVDETRPFVYPNPVASQLQIKHPNFGRDATLKICDLAGGEVYSTVLDYETGSTFVNLSALRAGMYLPSLKSDKSTENYRIIKN